MERREHEAGQAKMELGVRENIPSVFFPPFKQFHLTRLLDVTVPIKLVCVISGGGGKDCSWTPSRVAELIRDISWSMQNSAAQENWPKQSATTPKL